MPEYVPAMCAADLTAQAPGDQAWDVTEEQVRARLNALDSNISVSFVLDGNQTGQRLLTTPTGQSPRTPGFDAGVDFLAFPEGTWAFFGRGIDRPRRRARFSVEQPEPLPNVLRIVRSRRATRTDQLPRHDQPVCRWCITTAVRGERLQSSRFVMVARGSHGCARAGGEGRRIPALPHVVPSRDSAGRALRGTVTTGLNGSRYR